MRARAGGLSTPPIAVMDSLKLQQSLPIVLALVLVAALLRRRGRARRLREDRLWIGPALFGGLAAAYFCAAWQRGPMIGAAQAWIIAAAAAAGLGLGAIRAYSVNLFRDPEGVLMARQDLRSVLIFAALVALRGVARSQFGTGPGDSIPAFGLIPDSLVALALTAVLGRSLLLRRRIRRLDANLA